MGTCGKHWNFKRIGWLCCILRDVYVLVFLLKRICNKGVDCIFTLVLHCETFAESSDDQLHSGYPTLLRCHREPFRLGRWDEQIQRISQASNVKQPTCFIVTSWIVGSDEGHKSAIRSVCLFCHKTSISATLRQDMFGNITTSSPKLCQLTSVFPIMRIVWQSQQKGNENTKQEEFLDFFDISIGGPGSLLIKKVNQSTC